MDLTLPLVTIVVVLLAFRWFRRRTDHKFPPFPVRPLPLVGNLSHMGSNPRPVFKKWASQYGDVFSLYLASTHMVVLNGYDLIKEALVKKADAFSDRPMFLIGDVMGLTGKGIVVTSGDAWKEHRQVSMSILKTFGMGKNALAEKIQEEVGHYSDYLANLKEKPTDIRVMTNISVSNVISSILIGQQFDYDDQDFRNFIWNLTELSTTQQSCSIMNFIPWLQYLPGDIFKIKKLLAVAMNISSTVKNFVDEKMQDEVNEENVNNFIDAYLTEMNKRKSNGVPTILTEDCLVTVITEFFIVGTETISATIYWCILYIINYPEVQRKLQQQIDDVIGTSRRPNMQDMPKLTYLNAFIMESQRLASIAPLSVTHLCSEETTLRGYNIPKGAFIAPNMDSIMYSEKIWGSDVMQFKPERFLDGHGKLAVPEEFIPFGIGRRACLGESLAKMELFLFMSSLIQRFEFLPLDPSSPPSMDAKFSFVIHAPAYEVRIRERRDI